MKGIATHLWFDKEAKEAAAFYASLFPNSAVRSTATLHETPSGSVDLVTVDLAGQDFRLISAGPMFKFNPSISFLVACKTKDEVDSLWGELSKNGSALMELGSYPFSDHYGWTQDRYGLSWQLMLTSHHAPKQKITPTLMFVGAQAGKAEEAMKLYTSLFARSGIGDVLRWGKDEAPEREGTIKHAGFTLDGQAFAAMDSAGPHGFAFNEAISFMVQCETQKEIDEYWSRLSADPKAEQCGWLKDRFGVSWQIVPTAMDEMMASKDAKKIARVTQAFLKMKKFDVAKLKEAFEGA